MESSKDKTISRVKTKELCLFVRLSNYIFTCTMFFFPYSGSTSASASWTNLWTKKQGSSNILKQRDWENLTKRKLLKSHHTKKTWKNASYRNATRDGQCNSSRDTKVETGLEAYPVHRTVQTDQSNSLTISQALQVTGRRSQENGWKKKGVGAGYQQQKTGL